MTDSLPMLSIITPSYQQALYLEETVLSVLDQGYGNLEYTIMDGGSMDGSRAIIEKYQHKLAAWVSEADQGQADAINKGLQKAQGEIIGWINSDDYYLPGVFADVAAYFQTHADVGLIYGDVLAVDGGGQPINVMRYAPWDVHDLLQFRMIGQSSVFFRREVLQQSSLLDAQYHYLLDHQLWIRIAANCKIAYVPKIWSAARYHALAKNIANAANFGEDAQRIVAWAASEPMLKKIWQQDKRKIQAGAVWLDAFYQADAGNYSASLKAYLKVLVLHPRRFWQDWKKFAFVFFSWLDWGFVTKKLENMHKTRRAEQLRIALHEVGLEKLVEKQQEESDE